MSNRRGVTVLESAIFLVAFILTALVFGLYFISLGDRTVKTIEANPDADPKQTTLMDKLAELTETEDVETEEPSSIFDFIDYIVGTLRQVQGFLE